jgi:DNA-binding phage protein
MGRKKPLSVSTEEKGVVEQLRDAIRESGRTLQNLAEESGVGKDRLSRFMRGERDMTFGAVEKVCRALGLRLAGGEGASAGPVAGRSAPGPAIEPAGQKKPARGKRKGKGER